MSDETPKLYTPKSFESVKADMFGIMKRIGPQIEANMLESLLRDHVERAIAEMTKEMLAGVLVDISNIELNDDGTVRMNLNVAAPTPVEFIDLSINVIDDLTQPAAVVGALDEMIDIVERNAERLGIREHPAVEAYVTRKRGSFDIG